MKKYLKDFAKRLRADMKEMGNELKRVDDCVVRVNKGTNARFVEHVDAIEAIEESLFKQQQYLTSISAGKGINNNSTRSADFLLDEMKLRIQNLGSSLPRSSGAHAGGFSLLSPLHGSSRGQMGESSFLHEDITSSPMKSFSQSHMLAESSNISERLGAYASLTQNTETLLMVTFILIIGIITCGQIK